MRSLFGRRRVGLALGSGGAKGLAHIGVIKELLRAGVPIDMVSGSSIGAIVGALYAATEDVAFIEHVARTTNWNELRPLLDFRLGKGLLQGDKLERFLEGVLPVSDFSDLRLPFVTVATDMRSGHAHVFRTGSVARAIRASSSVPVIFRPIEIGGREYSDAGLSVPVPVRLARELGADVVIAVDLDAHTASGECPIHTIMDVAERTIHLLSVHLARENVRDADVVIAPAVADIGWGAFLSTAKTQAVIDLGAQSAFENMASVQRVVENPLQRWVRSLRL